MLDYTKLALQKTYEDFKKIGHVFSVVTQLIYIAYLVYSIVVQSGRWWIKTIFLALSVGYFIFYMVVYHTQNNQLNKRGTKIYKRSKLLLKLFELVVAFYSISVTTNDTSTLSVILLAMMLVGWLLQVVFDIIVSILEKRIQLFIEAVKADWQEVKKPIDSVSNFMKKLTGKPIAPAPEKTKQRVWLDEQVGATRQEKREQKRQQKEAIKAEKRVQREQARLDKYVPSTRHALTSHDPTPTHQDLLDIVQSPVEPEDRSKCKKRKNK